MSEYIITKEQIEELNRTHGGMKIVTSWLSCYAIWDTSNIYPVMKSEHVAIDLPEIVRCRDCRHYMDYENSFEPNLGYCREHDREEVRDNWFCAWGEKVSGDDR